MIYEIFNAVNGETQGYRFGLENAKRLIGRVPGAMRNEKTGELIVLDYLPAKDGFYVLDMRDSVKAGPFNNPNNADAKRAAEVFAGLENQASDTNSFRVYEQRN